MTKRLLECACCGGWAGRWVQFFNQDTGFGLCASCAAWIAGRWGKQEVLRSYGKPGKNFDGSQMKEGE